MYEIGNTPGSLEASRSGYFIREHSNVELIYVI